MNRGATATNHSVECRTNVAEELDKFGDERLEREKDRLLEHMEEEESKQKRQKQAKGVEIARRAHRPAGRRRSEEKYREAMKEF